MKRYNVTAKLWIKLDVQTEEEAETVAKNIIDEALYDYVVAHQKVPDVKAGISKAKITWVREHETNKKEIEK